jgi:hypothetical protein
MGCEEVEVSCDGDRVALRPAESGELVESGATNEHFIGLSGELSRREPLAKGTLEAKEGVLGETAPVISTLAFPFCASHRTDAAQVLIAQMAWASSLAVTPDARSASGRDRHAFDSMGGQQIVTASMIKSSVGAGLLDRVLHLRKEQGQRMSVGYFCAAGCGSEDLSGALIQGEVELSPGAPLANSMLSHLPFSFSEGFQAAGVDHQMQGFIAAPAWGEEEFAFESLATAAKRAEVRHGQIDFEQREDGAGKPFQGAQGQSKEGLQHEKRLERLLAQESTAAPAGHGRTAPTRQHLFINPKSETSTPHQGRVIVFPVAQPVTGLARGFRLHTESSRLLPLRNTSFSQQSQLP